MRNLNIDVVSCLFMKRYIALSIYRPSSSTYTSELYVARYILLGSNSCRLKLEEEGEKVAHLEPENHKLVKECRRLQKVPSIVSWCHSTL